MLFSGLNIFQWRVGIGDVCVIKGSIFLGINPWCWAGMLQY